MRLCIRYGRDGLEVTLPDEARISVLRMRRTPGIPDPDAVVRRALEEPIGSPPLRRIARGKRTAAITISDITRPVPNAMLLPPMLDVLNEAGIPDERIAIVIGTGLHRPNTPEEIREMVGPEVMRRVPIVNHRARDEETLAYLGTTSRGTPVWVNRLFVETDLHIATSLIEPHLMAGFSGGRKAICPGLAGLETMRVMHGPELLAHPLAREGVMEGNPFHEEAVEIARRARVDFLLTVSLNEEREITGVFAGDLEEAHMAGCRFVAERCTAYVDEPVEIVLTTSAGYPLDLTFYQSIKAMTAALPIVKEGGTIIVAAACAEGIGSPDFQRLMHQMRSVDEFRERLRDPAFFVVDQWQLQEMCKVLDRAEVWYYTDGLTEEAVRELFVIPVPSVEEGFARALRKYGADAKVAVIPEGPYVMPRVRCSSA